MAVVTLNQIQKDQELDPAYVQAIKDYQKLMAGAGAGSDYESALNAAVAARDQAEKNAQATQAKASNPALSSASSDTLAALDGGKTIPQAPAPSAPASPSGAAPAPDQSAVDQMVASIGQRTKGWGPQMIASVQKEIGAKPDGSWGKRSASALSSYMAQHPNAGVVPAGGSKLQFVSDLTALPENQGSYTIVPQWNTSSVLPVNLNEAKQAAYQLAILQGATPEQAQQMASIGSMPDRQSGSQSFGTKVMSARGSGASSQGGDQSLMQNLFLQQVANQPIGGDTAGSDAYRRELQNQLGSSALANTIIGGTNPVQTALQGENTLAASEDRNQANLLKAKMGDITQALNSARVQLSAYTKSEDDLRGRLAAADARVAAARLISKAGVRKTELEVAQRNQQTVLENLTRVQVAKYGVMRALIGNSLALVSPEAMQAGIAGAGDAAATETVRDINSLAAGILGKKSLPYPYVTESTLTGGDPEAKRSLLGEGADWLRAAAGLSPLYTQPKPPSIPLGSKPYDAAYPDAKYIRVTNKQGVVGWYDIVHRRFYPISEGSN